MPEEKLATVSEKIDDLKRLDDVLDAFLVTASGNRYSGKLPSKILNVGLMTLLASTMNTFIGLMNRLYAYKLDHIAVELQEVIIFIYAVDSNTAIVCIVPNLVNTGLIEVELETTRREIKKIIG